LGGIICCEHHKPGKTSYRPPLPTPTSPTPTQTCPNAIPDAPGDFIFGTSLPPNKGGGVGWGRPAAAAAKICSNRGSSSSARQGKRDKYRYEVECVTDVPIGCILNR